jgi:peptidoglycan lytic transglycosylase
LIASKWTAAVKLIAALALIASASAADAATKKKAAAPVKKHTALTKPAKIIPLPRPRPSIVAMIVASAGDGLPLATSSPATAPFAAPSQATLASLPPAAQQPAAAALASPLSAEELATIKQAVQLARKAQLSEATELAKSVSDSAARKLVEWAYLRSDESSPTFDRYMAFISVNPAWPSVGVFRRRAEGALWEDRRDPATIRAFFAGQSPTTSKGRFALARALLAQGDRKSAEHFVREAWRQDAFSSQLESAALAAFGDLITHDDNRARMYRHLYAEDTDDAMRIANKLGGSDLAIAKARKAVIGKADNAKALLEAVPVEARGDAGYLFGRIQWLRRNDQIAEAGQLMLTAPRDPGLLHNLDEWWVERRLLARKLLDIGDAKTAYRVARDAVTPPKENNRSEHHFTAGWIALRFLNDPATALPHFARIADGTLHQTTLARAGYWQGRAAEALGRREEARTHYQAASRYPAAYYGQLARARLGLPEIGLNPAPEPGAERRAALVQNEVVRAVAILYAIDQRDLILSIMIDLADRAYDPGLLAMLGELAARHKDARAMLYLGRGAIARGLPFEHYAFPTVGMPNYSTIGPEADASVVYAIARQESGFNQKVVSTANAMGLMQVTPAAGRYIAKKFGAKYDQKRLLNDPSYNTQFGAAEIGDLLKDYRGSYILSFAGYNAGRGRIRDWVARYGDPRDPKVDPLDWVERIPFSETRNYVQRVMENMQVYRARFGGGSRLLIEADLRRGATAN